MRTGVTFTLLKIIFSSLWSVLFLFNPVKVLMAGGWGCVTSFISVANTFFYTSHRWWSSCVWKAIKLPEEQRVSSMKCFLWASMIVSHDHIHTFNSQHDTTESVYMWGRVTDSHTLRVNIARKKIMMCEYVCSRDENDHVRDRKKI